MATHGHPLSVVFLDCLEDIPRTVFVALKPHVCAVGPASPNVANDEIDNSIILVNPELDESRGISSPFKLGLSSFLTPKKLDTRAMRGVWVG
jgi:hypothetical protein